MAIMSPAGDMLRPFWCSIMIQQVYEFVHLCYKYIGIDFLMVAAGVSSGSLNFKYDMISAI